MDSKQPTDHQVLQQVCLFAVTMMMMNTVAAARRLAHVGARSVSRPLSTLIPCRHALPLSHARQSPLLLTSAYSSLPSSPSTVMAAARTKLVSLAAASTDASTTSTTATTATTATATTTTTTTTTTTSPTTQTQTTDVAPRNTKPSNRPPTALLLMNMGGPHTLQEVEPSSSTCSLTRILSHCPSRPNWPPSSQGVVLPRSKSSHRAINLPAHTIELVQYAQIGGGSPIRMWTERQGKLVEQLMDKLSPETAPHKSYVAFRYSPPMTDEALRSMEQDGVQRAIALSLYPQYSCSTTGSSLNQLWRSLQEIDPQNKIKWSVIDRWPTHAKLIEVFARHIETSLSHYPEADRKDVVLLFSAHSLPMSVVNRGDPYPAEVAATVYHVMQRLGHSNPYRIVWQSQVGPSQWLGPKTNDAIEGYAKQGVKHLLAIPIAFVSDHVETLFELDIEYGHLAKEKGIDFQRVESLNDDALFIEALAEILRQSQFALSSIWVKLATTLFLNQKAAAPIPTDHVTATKARPKAFVEELLQGIVQYLLDHVTELEQLIMTHEDIVSSYATQWDRYQTASHYTNRICDFLNRHTLKRAALHTSVQAQKVLRLSLEGHAYLIWKQRVLSSIKRNHSNALTYQLLELLRRERDGDPVPSHSIKSAIGSLIQVSSLSEQPLQLYSEEFEMPYIRSITLYYMNESAMAISSLSISNFMIKALSRLDEEADRSQRYCHSSSFRKIAYACESEYISAHMAKIHGDFEKMIMESRFEDCTRAYELLSKVSGGIRTIIEEFEKFVFQSGKDAMARFDGSLEKSPVEYVNAMIDVHARLMNLAVAVFKGDSAFVAKVDKDVFQKFYSRSLAKRLIHSTSFSNDCERVMISRLKTVCGYEYTSKLQRMFTDISLSEDLNVRFKSYMEALPRQLGIEFEVLVLTAGSWPLVGNAVSNAQLPLEFENCSTQFTSFYNAIFSGRKLSWLHHLSKAEVWLNFTEKRYELHLSAYQLSVLSLFNDNWSMSLEACSDLTKIGLTELNKIIAVFVNMNLLLVDGDRTSHMDKDTVVSLNAAFSSKRLKIKVSNSSGAAAEQKQESDTTLKSVDEDRRLFIQATIVRIMKSRMRLSHNILVQEVTEHSKSRFLPSVTMIKRCIEQLIEKQYLSRFERDQYMYVA
ncbi:ferrochelatase [Batrachochytrium salamandrivorans]|nr:ferrochelatase [Batrachochytrium salamandrivorans]